MQYWEARSRIIKAYRNIVCDSAGFCGYDVYVGKLYIKRKSISIAREAVRRFIFRSAKTFKGGNI